MSAVLDTDAVPAELRERPQWVLWARVPDKDGKKPRKVPKQASGRDARTNDPATWTTFYAALERYQRGDMAGVGFVFTRDDPFVGIDLDDCLTDAGTLKLWAAGILERFGPTYCEISPSGNGVKLWVRATLPAGESGKKRTYHDGAVEVYQERRFFTVTGDKLDDAPSTIGDAQAGVDWLWSTIFAPARPSGQRPDNNRHSSGVGDDRPRVLDRARTYLAKLPAAVSGQAGHDATFHAACSLVLGFNLNEADALELLAEYNARCEPPWTERELRHKVQSAAEQPGERGYLLREPQRPQRAGEAPAVHDPVLTCLADVEPRDVAWLWPDRIPLGRITLLVGRPGEGKSFVTIDAAARVTTGTPWPDGRECPSGSVILISAEDDPHDTIRPRLDAHGADVRRVHLLSAVRRVDDAGQFERLITLADLDAIEGALVKLPDCRLIVVDPIGSFLGGRTDAHRDNEVRSVLAPIAALAERYGPAVLVVAHRRKSGAGFADDTALGSRAFTGIARAVWHLSSDPDNEDRRLLLPGKNNLAGEGDGLAFSIVGQSPHARISWEPDPVAMTADEALAAENKGHDAKRGPEAEAQGAAVKWLKAALAGGPRLAKELLDEWQSGQTGSKRTLDRAKQSLAAEAFRPTVPGPWWWRLPSNIANTAESKQLGNLGNLAKNSGNSSVFGGDSCNIAKLQQLGNLGPLVERNGVVHWPDD